MAEMDWPAIGQGIGVIGVVLLTAFGVVRGWFGGSGKPPESRAPDTHEVREYLNDMRRALDHMQRKVESADDKQDDIRSGMNDVKRALDRIEAAQRLQDALNGFRREGK